jgi:hypothetical protein
MPASKYTPKPAVYTCHQYDGTNFDDLASWAPITQEGGKVYLNTPMGKMEVHVSDWVMQDNYELFSLMADQHFKKGFKPGGGP